MTRSVGVTFVIAVSFLVTAHATAQTMSPDAVGTASAIEVHGGKAWFLDDQVIDATVWGGQARFRMSPLTSVGPEVTWVDGPSNDRDLYVTGNVWFDLRTTPRPARGVTPFLVVGGGLARHSWRGSARSFSSFELAVTGGGGARILLTPRWYVAPEVRVGWEPHVRISVNGGFVFGR